MLKVGDQAPSFDLETYGGKRVKLADFKGQRVVVYFYPRDDTPGCTVEAIDFTRERPKFDALGVRVLGVSKDSVKSHGSFRDKHRLGIDLLSDPDLGLHEAFGAYGEKTMYGKKVKGVLRSTFVIGPRGEIEKVWGSVKVKGHVDSVLKALSGGDSAEAAAPAPRVAAAKSVAPKSIAQKSGAQRSVTKQSVAATAKPVSKASKVARPAKSK